MMKPIRNKKYLAWIRSLPCIICSSTYGVEAAHTGPHGISQKSSDFTCIPLCRRHHRTGRDSYHQLGPRRFERTHQIELSWIVDYLIDACPTIKPQSPARATAADITELANGRNTNEVIHSKIIIRVAS